MVPQLVTCHKCNSVLYEGIELKPPDEIIQSYDGRCPACGRKLSHIPKDFEVNPIDITDQPNPFGTRKKTLSRKKRSKSKKAEKSRRNDHVRRRKLKKKKKVHERKNKPARARRRPIDYDYSWPFFGTQGG